MANIPHISGVREIADKYDYFLLDIYGLLHNGMSIFPDTISTLKKIKETGNKICLLSNIPKRSSEASRGLEYYGITSDLYDGIITAGEAAHFELTNSYKNKKCFYLGSSYDLTPFENLNIEFVQTVHEADFIYNSLHGKSIPESKLEAWFTEAADRQLKMLCPNPDMVVHIGDDLEICPGTYAAMYEKFGGAVSYYGKPYPQAYDMARALLGNPPKHKVCAMGDALHTDIRGACAYGIDGIWALSGIHWEELRYDHNPVEPDPARVKAAIAESPHKPAATISGFSW